MLGWIFGGMFSRFKQTTRDLMGTKNALEFLEKSSSQADYLLRNNFLRTEALRKNFESDIRGLIDRSDDMARDRLEQINIIRQETLHDVQTTLGGDGTVSNLINQISITLMQAIADAGKETQAVLGRTDELQEAIFQNANDAVDQAIKKIDLVVSGSIEEVKSLLSKIIAHPLPAPFDECKKSLGIHLKSGFSYSDEELYKLSRCYELKKLQPDTPIDRVVGIYGQLQLNAIRMAALSRNAPALYRLAVSDWLEFGQRCDFWYNLSKRHGQQDMLRFYIDSKDFQQRYLTSNRNIDEEI